MRTRFLIVGAGPTGLGAAHRLKELGIDDFRVIDAADRPGGLAASFVDENGFTWDVGGHVQFSHYPYFDELMQNVLGPEGWVRHERKSWIWIRDRFVPYPLQNNVRHLPENEAWECVHGLIDAHKASPEATPRNFSEWILAKFGGGVSRIFMEPYNAKVWAHPLESMDFGWIGERVAVVKPDQALKNILFKEDDTSWGGNSTFLFPKEGGTGAIWKAVAEHVGMDRISLGKRLAKVDPISKTAYLADGSTIAYETLLNTSPLDTFVHLIDGIAPEISDLSAKLRYSTTHVVGVGFSGRAPAPIREKSWIYFPEDSSPFYRVTVFSNYSPKNVPDPKSQWSLMAEVSESSHKPVDADSLVEDVLAGMKANGLYDSESKIASTWRYRAKHGYPIPFLGRDQVVKTLHSALEPLGIYSRGRFGGWKYEVSNQDHSLMQGVEWADSRILGIPEKTYLT